MQESDIAKMKVADLKRELKMRGLSVNGNKTELMERLLACEGVEGDELLDETILTDEDEANILADDEHELLQSPASLKINDGETKDEDDLLLSPTASAAPPKKIVLKRKSSFRDLEETTTSKENTKPASEPKVLKMSERNPIKMTSDDESKKETKAGSVKLSQLSEKERLELRAKKFGQTAAAASAVTTPSTAPITVGSSIAASEDQIEKLKKRAERFGVVSPAVAKLDEQERLMKRKERFGGATSSGSENSADAAEKARQRLERFKAAPITVASKE